MSGHCLGEIDARGEESRGEGERPMAIGVRERVE